MGALANGQVIETDWTDVEIVDRVGGGDAFAGGFIVGYLEQPEILSSDSSSGWPRARSSTPWPAISWPHPAPRSRRR